MATLHEKRGWAWTADERAARRRRVGEAHRLLRKVREQVRLVGHCLPRFKGPADDALREFETGLGHVATLDLSRRGRKYLPVSPEEVDRILDAVPALAGPWRQLTGSPEYLAAVRDANRAIKAANVRIREHNEAVAAQEAALDEQARDVFALIDAGDLAGALTLASERKLL
jgi:hypothetical protein